MTKVTVRVALFAMAVVVGTSAQASTLSDVDLGNLQFDVATNNYGANATGSSNGIGWEITTGGFPAHTSQNTYTINGSNYTFDDLHMGSGWTITFASAISSLLIFAENDNTDINGIDLGISPSDTAGLTAAATGTGYYVGTGSGYLLYEFSTPVTTVSNIFEGNYTGLNGGHDISFFANAAPVSAVPLPASGLLLLAGLGGALSLMRRRS